MVQYIFMVEVYLQFKQYNSDHLAACLDWNLAGYLLVHLPEQHNQAGSPLVKQVSIQDQELQFWQIGS